MPCESGVLLPLLLYIPSRSQEYLLSIIHPLALPSSLSSVCLASPTILHTINNSFHCFVSQHLESPHPPTCLLSSSMVLATASHPCPKSAHITLHFPKLSMTTFRDWLTLSSSHLRTRRQITYFRTGTTTNLLISNGLSAPTKV